MPTFEVELNGKTFEVEAPNAQAAAYAAGQMIGTKARANTRQDVAQGAASGLLEGLRGVAGAIPAGGLAIGPSVGAALSSVTGGLRSAAERMGAPRLAAGLGAVQGLITGKLDYEPQTQAGKYARTVASFAPNALSPARAGAGLIPQVAARTANVVLPGVASEAAGQAAAAIGAGRKGEMAARIAGGVIGGAAANARISARAKGAPEDRGLIRFNERTGGQDVGMMRSRAAEFRAEGIQPTLVDVTDESGRGVIRAAASRNTPGREAAQNFADARALDLPDRMSRQARRIMSDDPRTPDEIQAELSRTRAARADQAFGAVRDERVPLSEDAVLALRSPDGRKAIRAAARSAANSLNPQDRAIAAELNRLADEVIDAPGQVQVTVGMSQKISEGLFDAAERAARSGNRFASQQLGDLARAVRDNARTQVPGYGEALEGYAADSRLKDVAAVGEDFLRRNTDEFATGLQGATPDELALARATGRRAIERAAGENVSAAPGVARRIATASEQRSRNRALLGEEDAGRLERAMRLEERTVQNARYIAPNTGSQTQPRGQDAASLALGVIETGVNATNGNVIGAVRSGISTWLKTRGMTNEQAAALVELAIDPNRLDEALAIIERQAGRRTAQEFLQVVRSAGVLTAPAVTTANVQSSQ